MAHRLNLRDEKILALANHIGRKKPGSKAAYDFEAPEYLILEPVVTHEMCDVCMTMKILEHLTAEEVAARCGKSVEETHRILEELAEVGVCIVNVIDGKDVYWYDTWVPGIMEMMVNHPTNPYQYPQIAEAFEAYGRVRGAATAGMSPVGVGLMRVIPIEKAISGETRRASYEELSKYIEDNTIFSVSNCSCRTSREIMGEGCGHLKEDMCIQMGHGAEYYIRTKRGRQVTKEEVYAILRKAEENGLMHEIPNLDGSGKTHAICNCCGCGCFSMRTAEMFLNADMVRSNYVSHVDKEKCVACGQCVENCPVNALQLGQKVCSSKPVVESLERKDTPRDTEWGPANWNPEYRTNRKYVVDTGTAPCKTECPAHIGIQGYIKLAAQGKYTEALELIKKDNPFPAVCGRICNRRCEQACTRGDLDEPLAIDEIKKFIADQDLNEARRFVPTKRHDYSDKKIAIVGGGPAGLSCAYYLALDGYSITVFEKQQALGGMLTLGIPAFRLEKDVVNAEIEILRELGVAFKTGVEVGKDVTIPQLREQGYNAFYLAIGAQGGRKLGIEGEDAQGVLSGVGFVQDINLGKDIRLSGKVVVIGGGNVAVDVARSATRVGAAESGMYCLESEAEMPAAEDEVAEAREEGVSVHNGWGPVRILTEGGKVMGVEFKRCVSVFDENRRFSPKYDEKDTMTVPCDHVLLSIGQSIQWGKLLEGLSVELNPNQTIKADGFTYQTAEKDIFAGGDSYTGPKFAIDAIAAGKQASISIHRFVQPGQNLLYGRDRGEYKALDKEAVDFESYDRMPRQQATHKETHGFKDDRQTFTEEQVCRETERCLGCGATVVDKFLCVGCGQCTTKCKFDAITLERKYDGAGVALPDMKKALVPHVIKRKGKIVLKKMRGAFSKD